jgi:hypothetical protein
MNSNECAAVLGDKTLMFTGKTLLKHIAIYGFRADIEEKLNPCYNSTEQATRDVNRTRDITTSKYRKPAFTIY